jgi:hypothetical protein
MTLTKEQILRKVVGVQESKLRTLEVALMEGGNSTWSIPPAAFIVVDDGGVPDDRIASYFNVSAVGSVCAAGSADQATSTTFNQISPFDGKGTANP